ncbi:MAG: lipoyl synthase [Candidatus Hydrogenedentota bacterium]|nr:MAG: lipoyl synthase [Candidatus Hydrogenedentota bacterium]
MVRLRETGLSLRARKPPWIRGRLPSGETAAAVARLLGDRGLHTVCESALCPNIGECWSHGTATFMILGDVCTRSCGFCAVKSGRPAAPLSEEPQRVAEAAKRMRLRHVVITSVDRDDLPDGGAFQWAETIRAVRQSTKATIEVLIPDFRGKDGALETVLDARPDVLAHNLETVPRLYPQVRPKSDYSFSLEILSRASEAGFRTKSGIMVGIGEEVDEILPVMRDAVAAGVSIFTIGQYLRPSRRHLPVQRFVHPDEFEHWRRTGITLGFAHVESGPLVRSSYHAERGWDAVRPVAPVESGS